MRTRAAGRLPILLVTRILIGLQGAFWLVVTASFLLRRGRAASAAVPPIVLVLMALNGAMFIGASLALHRLGRVPLLLLAVYMAVNAVLAVADQIGVSDILALAADVVTLVLLLILSRTRLTTRRAGGGPA